MHRRAALLGSLVFALLATPLAADAQPAAKTYRIGLLCTGTCNDMEAFLEGLRELGYIEGRNIILDRRRAEGRWDRLPHLAAELVQLGVDLIVTWATPPTRAVKQATTTIPAVMIAVADPVGSGLVASLARPGGNITGLTSITPELNGKRLELLKELVPKLSRIAVMWNPENPAGVANWRQAQAAGQALGVRLQALEVRRPDELEGAFAAMARESAEALAVLPDLMFFTERRRIVDLATRTRRPAVYEWREFALLGGLMSYGTNLPDLDRRAATYVDKILKGAKPADLPIEQPTKFELVINRASRES